MIPESKKEWNKEQKDKFRDVMVEIWLKHNPSRNKAYFNFKLNMVDYVRNRIAADNVWKNERDVAAQHFYEEFG